MIEELALLTQVCVELLDEEPERAASGISSIHSMLQEVHLCQRLFIELVPRESARHAFWLKDETKRKMRCPYRRKQLYDSIGA